MLIEVGRSISKWIPLLATWMRGMLTSLPPNRITLLLTLPGSHLGFVKRPQPMVELHGVG